MKKYLLLTVVFALLLGCGGVSPKVTPIKSTSARTNTSAPTNTVEPTIPAKTFVPKLTDTLRPTSIPRATNTYTTKPPTSTPVPPATKTPVPELFLGDAVVNYGYALTAVSVQDPATPGTFYKATSGKKLIAVEIIISNLSGDMLGINPLYTTLVDSEGYTYEVELGGSDEQISMVDLNPGEKVKGLVAFVVPDNAIAASIKYAIEPFGDKLLKASLISAPEGHVPIVEPPSISGNLLPKLGDVVENFGYSLSAVTVEDPTTSNSFYKPKKGYKLVAVEIILGNVSGSDTLNVNPLYAYLVDNNGFVYSAELGGSTNDQINLIDLAVGEKVKGWIAYTIPENATPASIKYSTTPFEGNYLKTGLTK